MKKIPFSPPDITDDEINAVVRVLKTQWITSGAEGRAFEDAICKYVGAKGVNVLSSATSAMFLALKLYGIKEGDEVITSTYTYASSSNVILHTGAKVIFVDNDKDNFNISAKNIERVITDKTKAIIGIDVGGYPQDYDEINSIIESKKNIFKPSENKYQQELKKILYLSDAAHSIGGIYKNRAVGREAHFNSFSFHAVKNITTAEGGALVYNDIGSIKADEIHKDIAKWALNGQNKSALDKTTTGGWKYSIDMAGYKCNLSDIHSAIGLSQLKRYSEMLTHRKNIADIYNNILGSCKKVILPTLKTDTKESSYHLYMIRVDGFGEKERDKLIVDLAEQGIILNVHYIPLPMHKAYSDLGFKMSDYPNSYNMYKNEITLPLYSTLSVFDAKYIAENIKKYLDNI